MIKIGDFGISRILMGTSDMATTFTGTPYYMSPEILKHEGYNSKSDIWCVYIITLVRVYLYQYINIYKLIYTDQIIEILCCHKIDL